MRRGGKTEQWTRAEGTQLKGGLSVSSVGLVSTVTMQTKQQAPGSHCATAWEGAASCRNSSSKLGRRGSEVSRNIFYFTIRLGPRIVHSKLDLAAQLMFAPLETDQLSTAEVCIREIYASWEKTNEQKNFGIHASAASVSLHSLQRMHTRLQSTSESEKTHREEQRKCRRDRFKSI